ncbi:hypothetical protein [Sphingomonas sp.]|jgi:hypothetical protein|uniref:hypothetical protein n=1 Tax=Sphingomonas sp. TaxID=28214 RepID=UPI002DEA4D44|nr:hypothetical protein [Sphingomonas sp.]
MRKPGSVKSLEELGRVRLSPNFFMRDFLYSEIASFHGIPNIPGFPDRAIEAGTQLCEQLLEPLQARFGRISIRSAYRSPAVNQFGNEHGLNCASNEANYGGHIWDYADARTGATGATACIIVNSFVPYYERTGDWQALAWWVHDHLPYSEAEFFPKLAAFNLNWSSQPVRAIYSNVGKGRSCLTKPGMENWPGQHASEYAEWLAAGEG